MAEAKQRHLGIARSLYSEAYELLAKEPSLENLEKRTSLLAAAEALEKRSSTIQEWPFDEGLVSKIAVVVTSVVASVIARIILDALGY
jgi:hypothetical protein